MAGVPPVEIEDAAYYAGTPSGTARDLRPPSSDLLLADVRTTGPAQIGPIAPWDWLCHLLKETRNRLLIMNRKSRALFLKSYGMPPTIALRRKKATFSDHT